MTARVYVGGPVVEYDPQVYARIVEALRRRGLEVIADRERFRDMDAWQRGWRKAVGTCTHLLVLLGKHRVVGCGTLAEIVEARARRQQILFAQPTGAIRPLAGVWLEFLGGRSRQRVAVVHFAPRRRRREEGGP
jgi:hypothetical protein